MRYDVSYVVLARKYRPRNLEEVVGQEAIATTLRNAINSDHVAHAYLFAGPRGVGKTSMARILAMCLNCEKGPTATPCGKCQSCTRIFTGDDVDVLEIDGASNTGVDNVRELRSNAAYAPSHSRFKIYIIDEVHMLSDSAFNALLKTLEEPPPHVKFIFATTEPHALPDTVHSRCQRFDFRNISTDDIVQRLTQICRSESVQADEDALRAVARRARGGMRDSQSILDQLIAYNPERITLQTLSDVLGQPLGQQTLHMLDIIAHRDPGAALSLVDVVTGSGENVVEFLEEFQEQLRNLMVILASASTELLRDLPSEEIHKLSQLATRFNLPSVLYMLSVTAEASRRVRTGTERRMLAELAFVKLSTMEDMSTLDQILQRLDSFGVQAASASSSAPAATPVPPSSRAASVEPSSSTPPASPDPTPQQPTSGPAAQVTRVWNNVVSKLKAAKQHSLAAFLRDALIQDYSDGVVTLAFGKGFGFHRQQVSQQDNRTRIESILSECLGRSVRLVVVPMDRDGEATTNGIPTPTPPRQDTEHLISQAAKDPAVRKATDLFHGRVIDVEP